VRVHITGSLNPSPCTGIVLAAAHLLYPFVARVRERTISRSEAYREVTGELNTVLPAFAFKEFQVVCDATNNPPEYWSSGQVGLRVMIARDNTPEFFSDLFVLGILDDKLGRRFLHVHCVATPLNPEIEGPSL